MVTTTSWHKQTDQPLFEDVIWSKPENKRQAGSLLIIGGNGSAFSAVGQAHDLARQAGIGYSTICMPDSLKQQLGSLPETYFAPSTKTNAFAKEAGADFRALAAKNDGVLIAGDVGRGNEVGQALSALLISTAKPITITKDAIDIFSVEPHVLLDKENITIVASFGQLQKLLLGAKLASLTSTTGLVSFIDQVKNLRAVKASIITSFQGSIVVFSGGEVSSTKVLDEGAMWQLKVASFAAVSDLHYPQDRFKALTTAAHSSIHGHDETNLR